MAGYNKVPWTDEEKSQVYEMLREGKSHAQIGEALGRKQKTVTSLIDRERKAGSADVPPKRLGGGRLSDDDRDLAAFMVALGITHAQAGAAIGRTAGAVSTMVSRKHLVPAAGVTPLDRTRTVNRKWTEDEETLLSMLADRGWSSIRIAGLLKRTPSAVQTKRSHLGIIGDRYLSKQKPEGKWRKCMCCGQGFSSEWIGNRICSPCKDSELYRLAA